MTTVTDAINRILRLLSQVSGENVQLYAEDRVIDMLQSSYDTLFDKLWWPHRMRSTTVALNGTSGEATTNITTLLRFEDIKNIYRVGESRPLPEVPLNINPATLTGTIARCYGPTITTGKIFKCFPIEATGSVIVEHRTKQDPFADDVAVEIDFDVDLLVFNAVYEYLEDDGTNPGATEKYRNKFNDKFRDAFKKYGTRIIPFRRGVPRIPSDWSTLP